MPFSSPIDIDDDTEASSTLSELDYDQFTHSVDNEASSDSAASSLNASISQLPCKKRKLTATSTWSLSRDPLPHEPSRDGRNKIWYCSMCEWDSASLISARAHLGKKHGIQVQVGEVRAKRLRQERFTNIINKLGDSKQVEREEQEVKILREAINREAFNEALVQLITIRNLPYDAATWPELRALLMTVNYTAEEVAINAVETIPKLIEQSFVVHREILKSKLQNSLSKIHFSIDMWTSPNDRAFQAIVAHFIDADTRELQKALLALPELPSHGGEDQAAAFLQVAEQYNILGRIGYICGDNHGSNDKMCRFVSEGLKAKGLPYWDPTHHRIRCSGHIVNLALQAFLYLKDKDAIDEAVRQLEVDENSIIDKKLAQKMKEAQAAGWREIGTLGKVHNLIVHIRASEARWNSFKALCGRSIPLDNDTRWNSWYLVLEVIRNDKVQSAINAYATKWYKEVKDDFLTPEDWLIIEDTYSFLKPFYEITLMNQGDFSSIDQTLYTMDILIKHYERSKDRYRPNQRLLSAIITSWYTFDKYYKLTDETPAYAASILLHPSRRKTYITRHWNKKWHKASFDAVRKLWEDEYMHREIEPKLTSTNRSTEPSETELYMRMLDVTGSVEDEYEDFIKARPTSIQGTALQWWLDPTSRADYPRLSQMAIDILSIPSMSAEAERVFSGGRRTITWDRMRLGSTNIEYTECLKSWLRSHITAGGRLVATDIVAEVLEHRGLAERSTTTPSQVSSG